MWTTFNPLRRDSGGGRGEKEINVFIPSMGAWSVFGRMGNSEPVGGYWVFPVGGSLRELIFDK